MSATYYVNLSATSSGAGTSGAPLSYRQLVNYFNSSYGDAHGVTLDYDVTFMLSGNLDGLFEYATERNFFLDFALSTAGTFRFVGDGPVVIYKNDTGNYGWNQLVSCKSTAPEYTALSLSTFEFKNIGFITVTENFYIFAISSNNWSGTDGSHISSDCKDLIYKNCYFKSASNNDSDVIFAGWNGILKILGCTFANDCFIGTGQQPHMDVTIYDSYFATTAEFDDCNTLITLGNLSTADFINWNQCYHIEKYVAPTITAAVSLPDTSSFANAVASFSDSSLWLYSNFFADFDGVSNSYRILNDYVYDAWGNTRSGIGMFAFESISDLGTDYLNCIIQFMTNVKTKVYRTLSTITNVTEFLNITPLFGSELETLEYRDLELTLSADTRTGYSPFDITFTVTSAVPADSEIDYIEEYYFYPDYYREPATFTTYTSSVFTVTYSGFKGKTFDPAIRAKAVKYNDEEVSSDLIVNHNFIIAGFNPKEVLPSECITDYKTKRY